MAEPTVLVTAIEPATGLVGESGRGEGVGRLARLGHGDDKGPRIQRGRAVPELGSDVPAGRQTGPALEQSGRDGRSVRGAATGDELDALCGPDGVHDWLQFIEPDLVAVDATRDGRSDGHRLFVHLLEHEMLVAALLCRRDRPFDTVDRALALHAVEARDDDRPTPEVGYVTLVEEDRPGGCV